MKSHLKFTLDLAPNSMMRSATRKKDEGESHIKRETQDPIYRTHANSLSQYINTDPQKKIAENTLDTTTIQNTNHHPSHLHVTSRLLPHERHLEPFLDNIVQADGPL